MKRTTTFDPTKNLILVEGEVWGRGGSFTLRLALDTGASETLITPAIVDELGYSPREAVAMTGVYSAVGKEQGYILRVDRFAALGFAKEAFRVHIFDLPDRYPIDGLVGLSFLSAFNYEIRSADGQIVVEPTAR